MPGILSLSPLDDARRSQGPSCGAATRLRVRFAGLTLGLELVLMLLAGAAAGCLGSLLGIGGGVLIVPLLNAGLGLSFDQSAAVSLVGVLATAGSVGISSATRRRLNVRLAIVLLIFSVTGATFGAQLLDYFSDRAYKQIFGVTTGVIAVLMVTRFDRRNITSPSAEVNALGARFFDDDTAAMATYRVRRVPIGAAIAFVAGVLASLIGIGGGILIVPVLNALCGVPMRVAAATSAFMIGVTAVPGSIARFARGELGDFHLAAAVALGVFAGYQVGVLLSGRSQVGALKILMATVLGAVAGRYLVWN